MNTFTDQFMFNKENDAFIKAAMMGPNALRIAEEMASYLQLHEDMRILDLGCGCGLSSLLLAEKYKAAVFAADLWVSPSENYERFKLLGIDDRTIPIFCDATKDLPFANHYFDVIFSVDAYHYFGRSPDMLLSLIQHVKKGGLIAVAIPGWKSTVTNGVPDALKSFFTEEDAQCFQTIDWWKDLWQQTSGIELLACHEMDCCKQAWEEWLTSPNPYAVQDIGIMEADNGQYFNMIQLVAQVI